MKQIILCFAGILLSYVVFAQRANETIEQRIYYISQNNEGNIVDSYINKGELSFEFAPEAISLEKIGSDLWVYFTWYEKQLINNHVSFYFRNSVDSIQWSDWQMLYINPDIAEEPQISGYTKFYSSLQ